VILEIESNGQRKTVEVKSPGKILVDGNEISCDWLRLPDGCYSLIVNGRVYDFSIDMDTRACSVTGRSGTVHLHVSDPKNSTDNTTSEAGQSGLQRICADMPGKVIRLLASRGDKVCFDQGLLVLEAMKMQNEIRSTKAGAVADIGVEAGQTVKAGDFLISIE
jgi:biotin carboxyl carrier protein